jgi:hypothetical protein
VQSPVEDVGGPEVSCLCHEALFKWHIGEIASYQATIEEAISFVKEINDMHGLAIALHFAAIIAYFRRNPAEVERLASDVIELSTVTILPIGWLWEIFFAGGRAVLRAIGLKGFRRSSMRWKSLVPMA